MRTFCFIVLGIFVSMSTHARPAPSYWKFERFRMPSESGYSLVLTEHIFETRPIYYTVKVFNPEDSLVADFSHCVDKIVNSGENTREEIICLKEGERVYISIQYIGPTKVEALWAHNDESVSFANH